MPRFYFDTYDGYSDSRDETGEDLPDEQAARLAAIGALPPIADDVLPDGDNHTVAVTVRDRDGKPIFRAKLVLTTEWLAAPVSPSG